MAIVESASRKDQVIRTAAELFKVKGYAATSMRDLAHAMGIEAASLYSHIKSKEEILNILCFDMARQFIEALNQVEKKDISHSDKLREGIIAHVNVMVRDLTASAVFMNEHRHLNQPHLKEFLFKRISYINRFKRMIENGIQDGEFKPVDTKLAVMTLFSSLNWMPNWYDPVKTINPEQLGEQLADMLIMGLRK